MAQWKMMIEAPGSLFCHGLLLSKEDGENLDNYEPDKFSDLLLAHITQIAPKIAPSGWSNRYGTIPWKVPTSM